MFGTKRFTDLNKQDRPNVDMFHMNNNYELLYMLSPWLGPFPSSFLYMLSFGLGLFPG
jgi:hypothetical protein